MAGRRAQALSPKSATPSAPPDRLRVTEGGLDIASTAAAEQAVLRRLMAIINGASSSQPYLVEISTGQFRLYIGEAAEQARTAQGIVEKEETEREGFEPSVEC